ncbi:MAG: hypothetical protein RQ731_07980 [Anaerosomatales bacterium]|nr:hypothetical protein [Anaerosomatales bacterium]
MGTITTRFILSVTPKDLAEVAGECYPEVLRKHHPHTILPGLRLQELRPDGLHDILSGIAKDRLVRRRPSLITDPEWPDGLTITYASANPPHEYPGAPPELIRMAYYEPPMSFVVAATVTSRRRYAPFSELRPTTPTIFTE